MVKGVSQHKWPYHQHRSLGIADNSGLSSEQGGHLAALLVELLQRRLVLLLPHGGVLHLPLLKLLPLLSQPRDLLFLFAQTLAHAVIGPAGVL